MSLSYFNVKKLRRQSKQAEPDASKDDDVLKSPPAPAISTPGDEPAVSPILDEEDQRFLERLAAIAQEPEGTPPPLPNRPVVILDGEGRKKEVVGGGGRNAQEALLDGADTVALPLSPPPPPEIVVEDGEKSGEGKRKSVLGYFALAQSKFKKTVEKDRDRDASSSKDNKKDSKEKDKERDKKKEKVSGKDRANAASALHDAAESAKASEEAEAKKEEQDLSEILDQLNLSAVNNRVFSFSKESEDLLNKFKVVLKDLVNGVPTAYNDLEKLLTDSEAQLKKMYGNLPPFLQNLVKSLPAKISAALGPEILAAQAEKPGFDARQRAAGKGGGGGFSASGLKSKGKRVKVPSLKSLVSAEGAVATMLRSILQFLKLRFPAVMTGTNVLLSLAVFLLLFVFWYCHKRGRETRLEKERLAAEASTSNLGSSASSLTEDGDDGDSLLSTKGEPSRSEPADREKDDEPAPPLILHDDKEREDPPRASVDDLPSVSHLPDPQSVARL